MTRENTVSGILITGTSDNDSIVNYGDDVTIDSGSGDDTIFSGLDDQKADRVSINAGEGNNIVSVQSGSDSVTVLTGDGNNSIGSTSPNNVVFSGAGNDTVTFYTGADNNTVQTGDGDDVVDAVGHNVTIDTGAGNDKIHTYRNAYDITINAGTGDDAITLSGPVDTVHTNVVQYAAGDGIDTITDFTATDSLQITSGTISGAELVGNNVEISVGSGKIILAEANNMNINIVDADGILHQTIFSGGSSEDTVVNETLIVGTNGNDYLINDGGSNVTIQGLGGNDKIENTGDYSIIDAGDGKNFVSVAGAVFVTIKTGDGDNSIYSDRNGAGEVIYLGDGKNSVVTSNRNSTIMGGSGGNCITLHNGAFGSYVEPGSGNDVVAVGHYDITVDGGAGNDLINLYRDAENTLVKPGTGNDTITVHNNTHEQTFEYSSGNDLISGFDANDTLRIVGHALSSSIISDGNLILDFGDGSLTLAGVSSTESLNVEYMNTWVTLESGGFEYTGVATNDSSKSATFTVSGDSITSTDNLTVTHNVYFETEGGNRIAVAGLSGDASVDGIELGLGDDTGYSAHFMETANGIQSNIALMEVSDGASVGNNYSIGVDDSTAQIQFSDGEHVIFTNSYFSPTGSDFTTINADNSGNGFTLDIEEEQFSTISGLSSGYSIGINAGGNIGDSLAIHSDGKQGTISVQSGEVSKTFKVNGDKEFGLKFNEDSVELVNYEGWTTLSSGVYNYTSDSLDFTVEGSDINWDVFRIGNSAARQLYLAMTLSTEIFFLLFNKASYLLRRTRVIPLRR